MICLAVALYVGVNVHFLRSILPPAAREHRTATKTLIGHWLPQLAILWALVLLLQQIIVPLVLMTTALGCVRLANNTKMSVLREPLLPSDIVMVLRHVRSGRLLLHYVPHGKALLWLLSAALAGVVGLAGWEPWLFGRFRPFLAVLSPIPAVVLFARLGRQRLLIRLLLWCEAPFIDWDVVRSVATGGFFATFVRCIHMVPRPAVATGDAHWAETVLDELLADDNVPCAPPQKPNLIVVLAEAFFDPRTAGIRVEPNPLANFDDASRRSAHSGHCWVPVYGGWTVRPEYSLLTGVSMLSFANPIGNPYSALVHGTAHALPKYLQSLGYRTLLIHPYDRQFYGRDKVYRPLGFDAFLDEHSFSNAPLEGRYVSDIAVAARIEDELQGASDPIFLFCITMENHGPWEENGHPGSEAFTVQPPLSPASLSTFSDYLHHLQGADRMIQRLKDVVLSANTPTILLIVGDHCPALNDVLQEAGVSNLVVPGHQFTAAEMRAWPTPCFLLTNMPSSSPGSACADCDISFLPGLLLDCAGLNGDRFFRINSAVRRVLNGSLCDDGANSQVRQAYLRQSYEIAMFPERYAAGG
jgi:hypothetical protein